MKDIKEPGVRDVRRILKRIPRIGSDAIVARMYNDRRQDKQSRRIKIAYLQLTSEDLHYLENELYKQFPDHVFAVGHSFPKDSRSLRKYAAIHVKRKIIKD